MTECYLQTYYIRSLHNLEHAQAKTGQAVSAGPSLTMSMMFLILFLYIRALFVTSQFAYLFSKQVLS